MRILLAIDGSSYSDITTKTLQALRLSPQNEVTVMTVIPEHAFLGGITIDKLKGASTTKKKAQEEEAFKLIQGPVHLLDGQGLKVESLVRWGNPAHTILKVAEERNAALIVVGAKGLTNYPAFRLGSVSQAVMKHAKVSVLLARKKTLKPSKSTQPGGQGISIDRVLFATDGSRYADMAAKFLLDLPLPLTTKVIVLTVQSGMATLQKVPLLMPEIGQEVIANLLAAEEKEAQKIITGNSQQFRENGYKVISLIKEGAAGESILRTIDEYDPDVIAVGARGLSGIESLFLGSVSERLARHAPCSVLIVKP